MDFHHARLLQVYFHFGKRQKLKKNDVSYFKQDKLTTFEYAYKIILSMKKDDSHRLWWLSTLEFANPMGLFLNAIGWECFDLVSKVTLVFYSWFTIWIWAHYNGFRKHLQTIIKSKLFDWIIVPFGMKMPQVPFQRPWQIVFGAYMDKFLKVFVDDLNVHNMSWE
jgi:hypothetical protein